MPSMSAGLSPASGPPCQICAARDKRDRGFESISLQRRVTDEPGSARSPTEGGFPMGRQAPPQTRKGLAAPPPDIRQFTPMRPRTTCRAPAYAPWSIAKARNGMPRPRNRAGGAAALAQQSGLLPHDRKDRPRLPPVALYHTFELGAPIRRHAQTIDDEVFDPVHLVVPGQAPIDSDRPGC